MADGRPEIAVVEQFGVIVQAVVDRLAETCPVIKAVPQSISDGDEYKDCVQEQPWQDEQIRLVGARMSLAPDLSLPGQARQQ